MRKRNVAVRVNDLMQRGYVYYLAEAAGKNFHPDFKPQLTPNEMLECCPDDERLIWKIAMRW